jgi:hypothetical protein
MGGGAGSKEPFGEQGKPASSRVVDFVTEKAAASEAVPAKVNPREKQPQEEKPHP